MWINWMLMDSNEFSFMKPGHGDTLNENIASGVVDTASSAYQFLIALGIVGLVIGVILIACNLVTKKSGAAVHEVKDQMVSIVMAAGILFTATSLVLLAIGIGLG